ncbi:hypothetical protein LCGC14_2924700, partial [marine sediment metagenome]
MFVDRMETILFMFRLAHLNPVNQRIMYIGVATKRKGTQKPEQKDP